MSGWKNVLVYADGRPESSLALQAALRIAEHVRGAVTALDVLHYLPARIPTGLIALEQTELLGLMVEQRREQLLEEVEALRRQSKVDVHVTHGNPAFELIRRSARGKHDLIVKTARGRDVKHPTSFGSTALHLVRKSPAPVLLVSAEGALLETPKLLCALDLDESEAHHELNRRLLRASRELAAIYGAEIHVAYVIDRRGTEAYRAFLTAEAFERFAKERHRLLQQELESLLVGELGDVTELRVHLREGDPADELTDIVNGGRFSHLVMGSVVRARPGHLMGGLAEEVLSRVECTVLTLKPREFKTPIEVLPAA